MKEKIIAIYFGIAIIISPFYWKWGEYSYMGYGYNLGAASVWPISLFRSYPKIDGGSPYRFMESFPKVELSGKPQAHVDFYEAIGYLGMYHYMQGDPSVNRSQVEEMMSSSFIPREVIFAFVENPEIGQNLRKSMDGKTFGGIVRNKGKWERQFVDLLGKRKEAPSSRVGLGRSEAPFRSGHGSGGLDKIASSFNELMRFYQKCEMPHAYFNQEKNEVGHPFFKENNLTPYKVEHGFAYYHLETTYFGIPVVEIMIPASTWSVFAVTFDVPLGEARRRVKEALGSAFEHEDKSGEGMLPNLIADPKNERRSLFVCTSDY